MISVCVCCSVEAIAGLSLMIASQLCSAGVWCRWCLWMELRTDCCLSGTAATVHYLLWFLIKIVSTMTSWSVEPYEAVCLQCMSRCLGPTYPGLGNYYTYVMLNSWFSNCIDQKKVFVSSDASVIAIWSTVQCIFYCPCQEKQITSYMLCKRKSELKNGVNTYFEFIVNIFLVQ